MKQLSESEIHQRDSIRAFLKRNPRAVELVMLGLLARQTPGERACGSTFELNGRGFNREDGEFGSSLARWIKAGRRLTSRQHPHALRMACFYWRQVAVMADITAMRFPITHKVSGERGLCDIIARLDRFQAFPGVAA